MKRKIINHRWQCKKCGSWMGEDYEECTGCPDKIRRDKRIAKKMKDLKNERKEKKFLSMDGKILCPNCGKDLILYGLRNIRSGNMTCEVSILQPKHFLKYEEGEFEPNDIQNTFICNECEEELDLKKLGILA